MLLKSKRSNARTSTPCYDGVNWQSTIIKKKITHLDKLYESTVSGSRTLWSLSEEILKRWAQNHSDSIWGQFPYQEAVSLRTCWAEQSETVVWGSWVAGICKMGHWRGGSFAKTGLQISLVGWGLCRHLALSCADTCKMKLSKNYEITASVGLKSRQKY